MAAGAAGLRLLLAARRCVAVAADGRNAAPDKHSAANKVKNKRRTNIPYANLTETSFETPASSIVTP